MLIRYIPYSAVMPYENIFQKSDSNYCEMGTAGHKQNKIYLQSHYHARVAPNKSLPALRISQFVPAGVYQFTVYLG